MGGFDEEKNFVQPLFLTISEFYRNVDINVDILGREHKGVGMTNF